jgi:energy-coupling factor transporter ATP-binding protein EcfA2
MPSTPDPLPPALRAADRLRHVLVVGKTGTGKSTLLRALARDDLAAGKGLLLLDPHGDLAAELRAELPRGRRPGLAWFDPTDPDCPALNPLAHVPAEERPLAASAAVAAFRKLFAASWGPRSEHLLRHLFLALLDVRGATLEDARAMLVDEARRRWALKQVRDPSALFFWGYEFPSYGKQLQAEASAPLLNKLGAVLSNPFARAAVTRFRPRLDLPAKLAHGRVVLASLSKGRIGEDATVLLGGLLLGALQRAAMARAALPAAERRPFHVLVDEAGSFAPATLLELLAEARKYGVGLALAVQSLAALDPQVRAGLLGNCNALVSFRVGGEDAELLEREFAGRFGTRPLTGLDTGEMVARVGARDPQFLSKLA